MPTIETVEIIKPCALPRAIDLEVLKTLISQQEQLAEWVAKVPIEIQNCKSWSEIFEKGYQFHPTWGIKIPRKVDLGNYYLPVFCQVTGERLSSYPTGQFCMQNKVTKEKLFVGKDGQTYLTATQQWEIAPR